MEVTVETAEYSVKMGISKCGPVLASIKVHSREQFLTQLCGSKKAQYLTQHFGDSGKHRRRESCLRNCPVMSVFPCASLNLVFSSKTKLLICHLEFVLITPDEND